jgi:hypothetical protein
VEELFSTFQTPGVGAWWTPTDDGLRFQRISAGATNLRKLPLDGNSPTQVTDFKSDRIGD